MKMKTRQITVSAIMLAICIASQFFKNLSVYITGPVINAALILTVLYAGLACGIILSIITPVTAAMFPCIMAGNAILVLCVALLKGKLGSKAGFPVSIVIGSILKGLFMGVVISLIILPNMLPEKMAPMLKVLQLQFSLTQVVTALIGGVYAFIIAAALRKTSLGKQD